MLRRTAAWLLLGPLLAGGALAQPAAGPSVALTGMLGRRALLLVDGGAPVSVAAGETHRGVTVISTQGDEAVLEIGGRRHTLRVGAAPTNVGNTTPAGSGQRIVLTAVSGGHFVAQGSIHSRPVVFMVDTGATFVAMGVPDAQRIGLDYQRGQPVRLNTANGQVAGWRIQLGSVRIGDVEVFGIDAVVTQAAMPYVLLGNSFLSRFQMRRDNEQMVLERRY